MPVLPPVDVGFPLDPASAALASAAPAVASPGGPDGSGAAAAADRDARVSRSAVDAAGDHCSPRLPASIASLASRSACLFCSRGIHSYVTRPGGKTRAASAASGFMSGCLIFQRPDSCSTTSLESIRTRTDASGSSSYAAFRPAMSPRYSATLLVATPMYSAASTSVSPVTASRTTEP